LGPHNISGIGINWGIEGVRFREVPLYGTGLLKHLHTTK